MPLQCEAKSILNKSNILSGGIRTDTEARSHTCTRTPAPVVHCHNKIHFFLQRVMPNTRRQYRPCHCDTHKGREIHYKQFQRCTARREAQQMHKMVEPRVDNVIIEGAINQAMMVTRKDEYQLKDEVDLLCFKLFANYVEDNSSQESVTNNLTSIISTVGRFLPPEQLVKLPATFAQLRALFAPYLQRLIRIPVCPGDCQLLDETRPSSRYECWCDGSRNIAWR